MYTLHLLWCFTALSLAGRALSHSHRHEALDVHRRLLARQRPLSNSTQHPITSGLGSSTISTSTAIGSSSALPQTSTLSGGEIAVAVIGATYIAGVGGAVLMVGGVAHPLAAGTVVTVVKAADGGDTPDIETVSSPEPTQQPKTTDSPASESRSRPATSTTSSSTSATASSTASPALHIIFIAQKALAGQISAVKEVLEKEAVAKSVSEVVSDDTGLVVFFLANITPGQADAIGKQEGVDIVFLDESLPQDRAPSTPKPPAGLSSRDGGPQLARGSPINARDDTNPPGIRLQVGAVDELKVISLPKGATLAELPGFGYASEAGRGVTIYVVDTGANTESPEWTLMPGKKSFMFAQGSERTETDFLNHGTCVVSKASGHYYGTAKDADIVAVKLPPNFSIVGYFTALVDISNDVIQKKLKGKAVVNISLGSSFPGRFAPMIPKYKELLEKIMALDIVVVTASGNDYVGHSAPQGLTANCSSLKQAQEFGIDDVSDYLALFGPTTDIIVVGAVYNNGSRTFFSQGSGDQLTVSAPGMVVCADGDSPEAIETYGTSFSAPAVSGVIAVWLSQPQYESRLQVPGEVAANVKAMVKQFSYAHIEGQPNVIWNGIDPRRLSCATSSNQRRQASGAVAPACQATSAAPSSLTTSVRPRPTSTAPAASEPPATPSGQPPVPPKPKWSTNPSGFTRLLEKDGVASHSYDNTSDSASAGVTDNIEQWCLAQCGWSCNSVFLYRVLQVVRGEYEPYYICNQYNKKWSNDFIQEGISESDSGVVFQKS
ncbi:Subtilisin-like protease 3 [Colletotrichum trifolii]|uniref:Subtilisin-like protease 3 n=1 Tax=Colletotrichum trifolii TaxID=5466 RepID=A0A4R8RC28_COLTR|nr:Subtilisin-like protease 3 [Colletotrichum trifolii]